MPLISCLSQLKFMMMRRWWTGGHWSRDEVKVFNTVMVFTNIEPFPPPGGTCLTYHQILLIACRGWYFGKNEVAHNASTHYLAFKRKTLKLSTKHKLIIHSKTKVELIRRGVGYYDLEIGYNCLLHECAIDDGCLCLPPPSTSNSVLNKQKTARKCYSLKWVQQFRWIQ